MPALFLTFLATSFALLASGESVLVARLAQALGKARGLLAVCWLSSLVSSSVAAWLGASLGALLVPDAKTILAAFAFAAAGAELFLRRPASRPVEPTRSLGAILLVLLARQSTDAARFLVLALTVATGAPILSAIGGALGTGMILTLAWAMKERFEAAFGRPPLARLAALGSLLVAIVLVLSGKHLIG